MEKIDLKNRVTKKKASQKKVTKKKVAPNRKPSPKKPPPKKPVSERPPKKAPGILPTEEVVYEEPKLSRQQIKIRAEQLDMLPHEWLLRVALGEPVRQRMWVTRFINDGQTKVKELVEEDYYADFHTRVDCAKAAAPFYAPRLASQTDPKGKEIQAPGVMMIPVSDPADWEAAAKKHQAKLKHDVTS